MNIVNGLKKITKIPSSCFEHFIVAEVCEKSHETLSEKVHEVIEWLAADIFPLLNFFPKIFVYGFWSDNGDGKKLKGNKEAVWKNREARRRQEGDDERGRKDDETEDGKEKGEM